MKHSRTTWVVRTYLRFSRIFLPEPELQKKTQTFFGSPPAGAGGLPKKVCVFSAAQAPAKKSSRIVNTF